MCGLYNIIIYIVQCRTYIKYYNNVHYDVLYRVDNRRGWGSIFWNIFIVIKNDEHRFDKISKHSVGGGKGGPDPQTTRLQGTPPLTMSGGGEEKRVQDRPPVPPW